MSDEPISTPDFIARYRADDNEWWMRSSGEHQNYFDDTVEALEEMTLQRDGLLAMMMQAQVVLGHRQVQGCSPQRDDVRSWSIAWLRAMHQHSLAH